jgi:hypothetical protein
MGHAQSGLISSSMGCETSFRYPVSHGQNFALKTAAKKIGSPLLK